MTYHEIVGPDTFLDGLELGVWDEGIEYYIPISEYRQQQDLITDPEMSAYWADFLRVLGSLASRS
jgi:hypothetical protein